MAGTWEGLRLIEIDILTTIVLNFLHF